MNTPFQQDKHDNEKKRAICIMGAARTGTHLMNSIICQTGETPPLLSEALHLDELAKFQKRLETFATTYPDMYFSDPDDILDLTGPLLKHMTEQLCNKYNTSVCVYRAPALSWNADTLHRVFESTGIEFDFICMVRDPRDAIASFLRWNKKRLEKNEPPLCGEDEDILDFAIRRFWSQYKNILPIRNARNVHFIKYEELTRNPSKTARKLYQALRLDFSKFDQSADWRNVKADLSQTGRNGDCITELYNRPVSTSSIGSYKEELNHEQERMVLSRLSQYCKTFYPEIRLKAGKKKSSVKSQ